MWVQLFNCSMLALNNPRRLIRDCGGARGVCGGARGVIVIVVGNGHGDTSSNPGRN